jgi:hypothetical protein
MTRRGKSLEARARHYAYKHNLTVGEAKAWLTRKKEMWKALRLKGKR